jgi:hypothetical protein
MSKLKSFKGYIAENYYSTLNLYDDMEKEDIEYYVIQLLPVINKMLENTNQIKITIKQI